MSYYATFAVIMKIVVNSWMIAIAFVVGALLGIRYNIKESWDEFRSDMKTLKQEIAGTKRIVREDIQALNNKIADIQEIVKNVDTVSVKHEIIAELKELKQKIAAMILKGELSEDIKTLKEDVTTILSKLKEQKGIIHQVLEIVLILCDYFQNTLPWFIVGDTITTICSVVAKYYKSNQLIPV